MMRRWWVLALLLVAPLVQAAGVHAFLDRSHVSLGDTVTLNITSDGALGTPDLAPLQQDFAVLGTSTSSNVSIDNGKLTRTSQLGIALKPLHAGTLTIPPLAIGGAKTPALTLEVGAAPSGGEGKLGDRAFMEAGVSSSSPYVGQETVYTVRLFYQPGVQGALAAPQADGARLIPLERDHRYMVQRNGYAYQVLERSWAVIPTRSGAVSVQGPAFRGQSPGAGNLNLLLQNPNALLNNPNAILNAPFPGMGAPVRATAPAVVIKARAVPAGAGKPWLPARDVQLKLTGLPDSGKLQAGVPVTLTLQVSAEGLPADALPEPELPAIADARVYPDQSQDSTDAGGEWLHASRTRSFAIVPEKDGDLTIPAITLDWWDVVHDKPQQAVLPARSLRVSGAAVAAAPTLPAPGASAIRTGVPAAPATTPEAPGGSTGIWRDLAIASVALWLLVLVAGAWWWLRRRAALLAGFARGNAGVAPPAPAPAGVAALAPRELQRQALAAADAGDVVACSHALLAWGRAERPAVDNAAALIAALADTDQREALVDLQRARWKGGPGEQACVRVAHAFARGFAWTVEGPPQRGKMTEPLPPLYPMH